VKIHRAKINPALSGFTLIEFLAFIVLFLCMRFGAYFVHARMGGIFGWLLGGCLGLVVFLLGGLTLALLKDLVGGIPRLPKCQEGTCRGPGMFFGNNGDYKSQKLGGKYIYICQHGGRYDRRGRRFVIVNDDGTETPYLIWHPFRGWFPDGPAEPVSNKRGRPRKVTLWV
jgi:hypothetical protein